MPFSKKPIKYNRQVKRISPKVVEIINKRLDMGYSAIPTSSCDKCIFKEIQYEYETGDKPYEVIKQEYFQDWNRGDKPLFKCWRCGNIFYEGKNITVLFRG